MSIPKSWSALGLAIALQFTGVNCAIAAEAVPVVERGSAEQRAEVIQSIDAWRAAVVGKDRAALQRLYHEDLSYGHTDGVVVDKQGQIERTISPADRDFTAVDAEGVAVRVYGDQAYVTATYTFHIQQAGQPPRSARLSGLDVWTKAGGSWQLIARQLTRPTP